MQAWDAFLRDLEQKIGKETVEKWLRPLTVVNFDACNLYLEAQNSFQISWFEEHIQKKAQESFCNNNSHPIKIHLSTPSKQKKEDPKNVRPPPLDLQISADKLDSSMIFSNFIEDERNKLTLKFFKEIVPGAYNPIFLYGPAGIGKTHLLMATCHKLKETQLSVFYVHAETFTEHVVKAIRNSQMRQFREIYRNYDVLIIDDVHYFARRTATQEELFHTFNALQMSGKQIILSSHLAPSKIEEIEPRLISRFEWGIVLQLYPLTTQKMEEVIQNRAQLYHFPLAPDILKFLIENFSTSKSIMRALEALVLRHKSSTFLSIEMAQHYLTDLLNVEKKTQITPEKILSATSTFFGIGINEILGKSQSKECTLPRKLAMYLCRKKLALAYPVIGRIFGRDHSTVMSSIKQIEEKSTSNDIDSALEKIESFLNRE